MVITAALVVVAITTALLITYVISVDDAQLSDGYPYLVLKMTDPSAATLASAVAVLSGPK